MICLLAETTSDGFDYSVVTEYAFGAMLLLVLAALAMAGRQYFRDVVRPKAEQERRLLEDAHETNKTCQTRMTEAIEVMSISLPQINTKLDQHGDILKDHSEQLHDIHNRICKNQ